MGKKTPNPIDRHVGQRVRMRRMKKLLRRGRDVSDGSLAIPAASNFRG